MWTLIIDMKKGAACTFLAVLTKLKMMVSFLFEFFLLLETTWQHNQNDSRANNASWVSDSIEGRLDFVYLEILRGSCCDLVLQA